MKLARCMMLALTLALLTAAPHPAAAQTKDCRTIRSVTVRQACLDRQAAEHPGASSQGDANEQMKREDEMLSKSLKSICRGC